MGETLGSYKLIRLLGKGGMGEVYLARDGRLQRDVALKLLPDEVARDTERLKRFVREARAAAALNHPNITTVLDAGEEGGRHYITHEYVEGVGLVELLAERELDVDELIGFAAALADAIAYAHEHGVIHRDLKAGNVIVTPRGDPKLLDFGLAKLLHDYGDSDSDTVGDSTTLTVLGMMLGTPCAMSPEQARGEAVDARTDIFSFGSLLYEMAARRPAFLADNLHETLDRVIRHEPEKLSRVRGDLPKAFVAVVEKALRKSPDERHGSMAEMAAALRDLDPRRERSGASTAPAPPTPLGWLAIIFAVLLVLMSAYAALDWFANMRGEG